VTIAIPKTTRKNKIDYIFANKTDLLHSTNCLSDWTLSDHLQLICYLYSDLAVTRHILFDKNLAKIRNNINYQKCNGDLHVFL
jgi:hypothetical protein